MVDNMLVSYAQNFEDVILWRALKDVKDGLYIDVGEHDPEVDSVSLLFYQKGWRGIHVEPVYEFADGFVLHALTKRSSRRRLARKRRR